jgi:hypothetical protein
VSASFNRNTGFGWYFGLGAGDLTAAATDLDARKSIPARNVLRLESARTIVKEQPAHPRPARPISSGGHAYFIIYLTKVK